MNWSYKTENVCIKRATWKKYVHKTCNIENGLLADDEDDLGGDIMDVDYEVHGNMVCSLPKFKKFLHNLLFYRVYYYFVLKLMTYFLKSMDWKIISVLFKLSLNDKKVKLILNEIVIIFAKNRISIQIKFLWFWPKFK